jgi:hypothetical protein
MYGGFLSTSVSFYDFYEIWYERHAIGGHPNAVNVFIKFTQINKNMADTLSEVE